MDKLTLVEDKYIDEAADVHPRRVRIGRLTAVAAAFVLCVLAAALAFTQLHTPVIIDENGFYIEDGVLQSYSGSDTDVVLPEAVTAIADYAFRDNESRAATQVVRADRRAEKFAPSVHDSRAALYRNIRTHFFKLRRMRKPCGEHFVLYDRIAERRRGKHGHLRLQVRREIRVRTGGQREGFLRFSRF